MKLKSTPDKTINGETSFSVHTTHGWLEFTRHAQHMSVLNEETGEFLYSGEVYTDLVFATGEKREKLAQEWADDYYAPDDQEDENV